MNLRANHTFLGVGLVLLLMAVPQARAQAYDLWFSTDCGGQILQDSFLELSGTVGQPDAGILTGSGYELSGGFWLVGQFNCGSADFNCDGDTGTDADIEAFFACLAGTCPTAPCQNSADFDQDGDTGTDADIEAFFRVLAGGSC